MLKYTRGIEEVQRIDTRVSVAMFMQEARDFPERVRQDFFKSALFNKDFKLEGDSILSSIRI